jgi:hypothetical protein
MKNIRKILSILGIILLSFLLSSETNALKFSTKYENLNYTDFSKLLQDND